jgi:hypothetical protein
MRRSRNLRPGLEFLERKLSPSDLVAIPVVAAVAAPPDPSQPVDPSPPTNGPDPLPVGDGGDPPTGTPIIPGNSGLPTAQ